MKKNGRSLKNQSGFTLVEIAVVLVIIGLLIGGILQGTELIENSRIKKASSDVSGISAAYISYQDRYRRLPGDDGPDATVQGRGTDWASVTGGNNNGVLTANRNNTFNANGEHTEFWQHLKAAGYISGNPADTGTASQPRNPWGGLTGITTQDVYNGLTGLKICMSQVPGASASALDLQIDDGLPRTGNMRSGTGTAGTNTAPTTAQGPAAYDEDDEYTVCVGV